MYVLGLITTTTTITTEEKLPWICIESAEI
jgi:hypothetical protein